MLDILDFQSDPFKDMHGAAHYLKVLREQYDVANLSYWHVGRNREEPSSEEAGEESFWLSTYPKGYQEAYLMQELQRHDPAFSLTFSRLLPTDWDVIHKMEKGKMVLEAAGDYHIPSRGISIPIRDENTGDSLFNINVRCSAEQWMRIRNGLARDFLLVAQAFHTMIRPLFVPRFSCPERPSLWVPPKLSPREYEVLKLASQGLTSKQIAKRLGLSSNTVRVFMQLIKKRLRTKTKSEAIALASSHGLLR